MEEYFAAPRKGPHNDRKHASPQDLEENSMSIDPPNQPASKSIRRLHITRQHRVSTPPPLPSPNLPYAQAEKFPAWLLGDSMAKSSAKYLASRKTQDLPQTSPFSSQTQPNIPTSPVRRATSSFLGNSPLKHIHFQNPLSRQSSSSQLDFKRHSTGRSISPKEALDRRREKFWELYEYDATSPHLQSKYFDKPLPTNEHWSDLDIQNISLVPEPKPGPTAVHLYEVFTPTVINPAHPQPPSDSLSQAELHSQSLQNKSVQQEKINSIPFGFNFLPSDYAGHKK